MKKYLVYLIIFPLIIAFQGCDLNDDNDFSYSFEALEITDAEFPDSFELGQIYRIYVSMNKPSDCHYFEGFDFYRTGETATERTVYAIGSVLNRSDCLPLEEETIIAYFNFEVLFTGTYVFKLYTGTDENGENDFLIYEVPVITPP